MNRISYGLLIAGLITSCAISKNEKMMEQKLSAEATELVIPVFSNDLSEEQLEEFEDRSLEILQDFYDYLDILTDSSINNEVKSETLKSLKELFYSEKLTVFPTTYDLALSFESIENIANSLKIQESMQLLECAVQQPLQVQASGEYRGKIEFQLKQGNLEKAKHASVELRKVKKPIGGEETQIWKIYLLDIN